MGVHRLLARRPREESEAAVLRRHERYRVALIVGELCGGEMSCPAKLGRVENRGDSTFDRFGQGDVFHLGPPLPPCDLGSERQQFILRCQDRGAVDCRQTGGSLHGSIKCFLPGALVLFGRCLPAQIRELAERRRERV